VLHRSHATTAPNHYTDNVLHPRHLVHRLLKGQSPREWFVEFVRFCVVGLGSYVVDVGLFNLLAHTGLVHLPGDQSMTAKIISVSVSVVFSWMVNRMWTFGDRRMANKTREFIMFVLVNIGGMLIALACLAFSRYGLGLRSQFADNISANIVGLALGTAFRYIMYRYVVFSGQHDNQDATVPTRATDDDDYADGGGATGESKAGDGATGKSDAGNDGATGDGRPDDDAKEAYEPVPAV